MHLQCGAMGGRGGGGVGGGERGDCGYHAELTSHVQ